MMKIQMMRKMKWKLTMQKSTKIAPDDWGEDVDLNEEDDEFQMMMLKTSRNKS